MFGIISESTIDRVEPYNPKTILNTVESEIRELENQRSEIRELEN